MTNRKPFFDLVDRLLQIGDKLTSVNRRFSQAQGFARELLEVEMLILMQQQQSLSVEVAAMNY